MQQQRMDALTKAIATLDSGEFQYPDICEENWDALYVGDKVKQGREFLELVRKGVFEGVRDTGKKQAGRRLYLKVS